MHAPRENRASDNALFLSFVKLRFRFLAQRTLKSNSAANNDANDIEDEAGSENCDEDVDGDEGVAGDCEIHQYNNSGLKAFTMVA
jgi:hypothetical protein